MEGGNHRKWEDLGAFRAVPISYLSTATLFGGGGKIRSDENVRVACKMAVSEMNTPGIGGFLRGRVYPEWGVVPRRTKERVGGKLVEEKIKSTFVILERITGQ